VRAKLRIAPLVEKTRFFRFMAIFSQNVTLKGEFAQVGSKVKYPTGSDQGENSGTFSLKIR